MTSLSNLNLGVSGSDFSEYDAMLNATVSSPSNNSQSTTGSLANQGNTGWLFTPPDDFTGDLASDPSSGPIEENTSAWNFSNSQPLFPNITNQIRATLTQQSSPYSSSGPSAPEPPLVTQEVPSYSLASGPVPPELLSTIKATTRPTRRKMIRRIRQMKQSIKGMEQTLFADASGGPQLMEGGGGRHTKKNHSQPHNFKNVARSGRRDAKEIPPPRTNRPYMSSGEDPFGPVGSKQAIVHENARPLKPIKFKVDPCKIPDEDDATTTSVSAIFKKPQKELKKLTRRIKRLQTALEIIRQ